jgi:membrane protein
MRPNVTTLLKDTFAEWNKDKAMRLSAALAYYAAFSIPPLLILIIGVIGLVYSGDVTGKVQEQIAQVLGNDAAKAMMTTLYDEGTKGGVIGTIIGILLLLVGASGVFGQLHDALNTIWEVEPKYSSGIAAFVKDRFFSFTMVLGVAFLLLVSLVLSAMVAAIGSYVGAYIPGGEAVAHLLEILFSFAVTTVLFALIFKYVPDVKIGWRDVWVGAAGTAILFAIGKFAIGMYLGKSDLGSAYGAAGSLVIVLAWVYYSSMILFLGAEFTQVYAAAAGHRVEPARNAVPVTAEKRAEQGIPQPSGVVSAPPEEQAQPAIGISWIGIAALVSGLFIGRQSRRTQSGGQPDRQNPAA